MEDVVEPSIFSRKSLQQPVSRTVSRKERSSAAFVESFLSESGEEENNASFEGLGVAEWLVRTCRELGMKKPTPVQQGCVSQILAGKDVFGLAQTGSGKTAAFALPILQKLAENPYGVYALVLTPTRELAFQISDQFKALGSGMNLRNTVVIGGMDMTAQAKALMQRPHVVIATPGRMRDHLTNDPDIAAVFARTKVVCLSVCQPLCHYCLFLS